MCVGWYHSSHAMHCSSSSAAGWYERSQVQNRFSKLWPYTFSPELAGAGSAAAPGGCALHRMPASADRVGQSHRKRRRTPTSSITWSLWHRSMHGSHTPTGLPTASAHVRQLYIACVMPAVTIGVSVVAAAAAAVAAMAANSGPAKL